MSIFNKFNSFVAALANKTHNLGADQLKIALCNVAPVAGNAILGDLTEIADYSHCSTRNIVTISSTQAAGLYKLMLTDLTLTASGGTVGPFRYLVIYNDSASSKELIGWYDYGSPITLAATETILIDFDGVNGAISLT